MSYSAKVNGIYYDLESFEKRIQLTPLTTPKFEIEVQRFKWELHRLHWDANHLDEVLRIARFTSHYDSHKRQIEKRIFILENEIAFVKQQFIAFIQWNNNPPKYTSCFSSPSNSPGSSLSNSPYVPSQSQSSFSSSANTFGGGGGCLSPSHFGLLSQMSSSQSSWTSSGSFSGSQNQLPSSGSTNSLSSSGGFGSGSSGCRHGRIRFRH